MVKKQYTKEERKLLTLASLTLIFISIEMPFNMFFQNELLGLILTIVNGVIVGFLIYYLVSYNKKVKLTKESNSKLTDESIRG